MKQRAFVAAGLLCYLFKWVLFTCDFIRTWRGTNPSQGNKLAWLQSKGFTTHNTSGNKMTTK